MCLDTSRITGDDRGMSIALLLHIVGAGVWVLLIIAGAVYQAKGNQALTRIFQAFLLSIVWQMGTGMWLYVASPGYSLWRLCAQLGLYVAVSFVYAAFLLRSIRWNRSQRVTVLVDSNNS